MLITMLGIGIAGAIPLWAMNDSADLIASLLGGVVLCISSFWTKCVPST